MLGLFKKSKKDYRKLLYSPVYVQELAGVMFQIGEMVPHARMKILTQTSGTMAGMAFRNDETLYFVANHPKVLEHIQSLGCVPLVHSRYLRFFKDKKRMNHYLAKVAI